MFSMALFLVTHAFAIATVFEKPIEAIFNPET
ncbi:MAG: DNA-binding XRE family transcriptional regulator [Pseudohongiellaceae bacterium]|jgi:DNA-binding XRE family transcriptional regulator